MKLVPGRVICACSWHGELGAKTPCPSCGRPAVDRIDAARLVVLLRVLADPDADLQPRTMPIRLVAIGVLRRDSAKIPPSTDGRHKHAVTALGFAVLAAAAALDKADREAEQRREYVAASVARHAALDE